MLLAFIINSVTLVGLASARKTLKDDWAKAMAFGSIRIAVAILSGAAVSAMYGVRAGGTFSIRVNLLGLILYGVIGFLLAWAIFALLTRIDRVELANLQRRREKPPRKAQMLVFEWLGVVFAGLLVLFT